MRIYGDPKSDYEGDNPWWTVRFAEPISAQQLETLDEWLIETAPDLGLCFDDSFEGGRQVQVGADAFATSPAEWAAFYEGAERAFGALHARRPITALFFQEGQFYGEGEELTGLHDDALP